MKTFAASLASLTICAQSFAGQFRGLWVDAFGPGFFNSSEVSNLVAACRQYNFNAVLVEMRARGNAFYMPHPPNGDNRSHLRVSSHYTLWGCTMTHGTF